MIIIKCFRAEGFKVGCDWTRAVYSSNGDFVTAGSSDGNIYVWNTSSELLHAVLKNHQSVSLNSEKLLNILFILIYLNYNLNYFSNFPVSPINYK